MTLNNKYVVNPEFEDLFAFNSEKEEMEHEAKMIMFRFLNSFENILDQPIKKKDIAEAIERSPSYVTQLFCGDKIINLITLAKLEQKFDITFNIQARKKHSDYDEIAEKIVKIISFTPRERKSNPIRNCFDSIPLYAISDKIIPSTRSSMEEEKHTLAI